MTSRFTTCVTHDIDSLHYKLRYRVQAFFKSGEGRALDSSFNPCRAFDACLEIERSVGARPTYFFLDYDRDVLNAVASAGGEIALHAEAAVMENVSRLAFEKQKLERQAGVEVSGVRQHKYASVPINFELAWNNQKELGFLYDSSLGIRRGVSYDEPFEPRIGVVELPPHVMDSVLIYDLRMNPEKAFLKTAEVIDGIAERKGVFVFLTHLNNIFDPYHLPQWRNYFERVLAYCKEKRAVFKTCKETASEYLSSMKKQGR